MRQKRFYNWVKEKGYSISPKGDMIRPDGSKIGGTKKEGYMCTGLRFDDTTLSVFFHRLQAFQKYGNKLFEKGIVVRHLDGNPLNNSFENIAIGTDHDNAMDIPKEKRRLRASHPIYDHEAIVADRAEGMSYKNLMKKHGISSKGTLSFIINKSMAQERASV